MSRTSQIERNTKETNISISLNIDGTGTYEIDTTIPFFDHMLSLMSKHGLFDLKIEASGDTEVDFHHTVEDVGICLGMAIKDALKDKKGMKRYGTATVPMDEALATVSLDISARPELVFKVETPKTKIGDFDTELVKEFFKALSNHGGITLHINLHYGSNLHHIIEAIFKAFAQALDQATSIDPRITDILSTKGEL